MFISKNPKVWWLLHWSHPWVHWWNWKKNTIKKDIKSKACMHVKLLQLCTTLWDPMDCSPPGCSVHGILQARILEWIVISFAMRSSQGRDQTCVSRGSYTAGGLITAELPGKPKSKADDCKYDKVIFQRQKISLKKESFYSIWVAVQEKHMTTLYLQPICMKKKEKSESYFLAVIVPGKQILRQPPELPD